MGAKWAVEQGYGTFEDLERLESQGQLKGADASKVSKRAKERGLEQLGTLGSGNHFLEVQKVDEIFDEAVAKQMGLSLGQVTIMLHTGSRGLGHQVATDYIDVMLKASKKYGINLLISSWLRLPLRVKKVGITGQRCSAQRILLGLTASDY